MLGNLMYQTVAPSETLVLVSGISSGRLARLRENFPHARFTATGNLNDWGHEKRSVGLNSAAGEYVGFFNDDDTYANNYLEVMLTRAAQTGADVVYCSWNEIPDCAFQTCSSTAGNFIVRTSVGRRAGYVSRDYTADGHFISSVQRFMNEAVKVNDILYFHNV